MLPEVTQFRLKGSTSGDDETRSKDLLRDGVMLLALRRFPGNQANRERRHTAVRLHALSTLQRAV